jgi:hypothetical protein
LPERNLDGGDSSFQQVPLPKNAIKNNASRTNNTYPDNFTGVKRSEAAKYGKSRVTTVVRYTPNDEKLPPDIMLLA